MKNKIFLTAVILSACMFLFICPAVSGRINEADDYGAFAACDTWQKWAEHITNGDFEFTGFARHDNEGSDEYASFYDDEQSDMDGSYEAYDYDADDEEDACSD